MRKSSHTKNAVASGSGLALSTGIQDRGAGLVARIVVPLLLIVGCQTKKGPDLVARPVPVTAATVVRHDVPVVLDGLGNVVAFKTVTVKTQVDGRLDKVFFNEGDFVKEGQVIAQIDPRPFQIQLEQAEGSLARDKAQLSSARLDLERYQPLAKEKLLAQQQVDDQAGTVGQLEGAVQVDTANIDTAKLNLTYSRIASPVGGVTGIRIVDPGNIVHATDPSGIVIVTQLDPIAVIFNLPQDDFEVVSSAMSSGSLEVEIFGRDTSTPIGKGELKLIDNQINQATSTIRLKAVLNNPNHKLWPNQFVNVRLKVSTMKDVLVMPATAVQRGPNGSFVYVIGQDSTVQAKAVQVSLGEADTVVVESGLSDGDRVVADGQAQLRPGARVAVQGQPPAPPPAKASGVEKAGTATQEASAR